MRRGTPTFVGIDRARLDLAKLSRDVQSSRPFHGERWIDHHWLQTGQSRDRMCNIVTRLANDRALEPALPVFCSEAFYEVASDPDSANHARWQVWTAFLNGAAGYGYGAQGLWQFLDRADPQGETGKLTDSRPAPWREALRLPDSAQVVHARTLLAPREWWKLEPRRDALRVDGRPNPLPTRADHCYIIAGPKGAGKTTFATEFLPLYANCRQLIG